MPSPAAVGENRIAASLGKSGELSLSVNAAAPVTAKSPGLIGRHPQEDFCVGHDNANSVDPEAPAGPFRGKLAELSVSPE